MAGNSPQQTNRFPRHDHALQNARVLPAVENDPFEGHWENIQQPGSTADPGRLQDPHYLDIEHYAMAGYHRPVLGDPADPYVFPFAGPDQGVQTQGQAEAPDHGHFSYTRQHVAPGAARVAIPHPFIHRAPTPIQPREDNLRRLASRYLSHADSQVNIVWMEPGAAGRFNVVIILDVFEVL